MENLYYVHKDYLGSILCLSNESGNVVERYSFDSWGHRRNPSDWSQWENGTSYITDRGFTGHQHMDLFGLINMNGRIYDPDLGRFISPDPYVQMPNNSQNFNRYSYALNNPLVYTDPSGEFLDLALFLGGSAIMGGWFWGSDGDNFNWNKAWKGAGATLLMTGTMVASAALPGLIPSHPGALPGLIMTSGQFGLTAINTGAYSWMTTGDFDPNWAAAGISAIPGLISSVAGGIDAVKHGGDFWTGEGAIYAYKLPGGGITRVEAKNYLKNYKNWDWDLELLKDRYKGMFGIEENDFNISLHTKPGDNWGLTSGGKYFHLHDKYIAGGYTKYGKWFSSNIFISPGVVKTNAIEFQAVAGHELIHAVHGNMMVGHPFEKATESMAYQYSYNVYLSNGYFNKAMNIRSYAIRKGWWNIWKPKYDIHIPSPLGISIP
jgi:RHS repeat-associated protein